MRSSATGFTVAILKISFKSALVALFIFLKASALTQRYKVLPSLGALRVIATKTVGGFLFVKGLAKTVMLSSVPVKHVWF